MLSYAKLASFLEVTAGEKQELAAALKAKGDEHAAFLAEFDKKHGRGL